jgi:BRCA1-associated protein
VCGTTENNYVCLICGVISCGEGGGSSGAAAAAQRRRRQQQQQQQQQQSSPQRAAANGGGGDVPPRGRSGEEAATESSARPTGGGGGDDDDAAPSSHARAHYDETLHAYALNTETQHVWDFAGRGYVHRLLQNKEDGKLVEVSDPHNTTSRERTLCPGLSDAQEGEVVHRKLEGFASQYYTLLKSQLEQQRIFYEGRLEEIRREHERPKDKKRTADLVAALRQERHQLSQRLASVRARCRRAREDAAFLGSMNESLEANRAQLRKQVEQAQRNRVEARKVLGDRLPPLQERVTRLMLQLESSSSSFAAAEPEQAPPPPPPPVDHSSKKKKKPAARRKA